MNENIKNKVLEIMALAVDFNSTQTKKILTKDKPTIFVEFCGHTCQLDVSVCPTGWDGDCIKKDKYSVYLDEDGAEIRLDKMLAAMKKAISDWENKKNENA